MKKVIVVEDSSIVTRVLRHVVKQELPFDVYFADSFAKAKELYEEHKDDLFAALVDLNLPDAPDGEVVNYMLEKKVPTIVLTGSCDDERRERLLSMGIVDYVIKEGRYSYNYAVRMINRLHSNQSVKVLVVEDSTTTRKYIVSQLKRHLFEVYEAEDGVEAIKVIIDVPDIKLLITDYNMPNMDGFELVQNLRCKYEKYDLVIIGLSAEGKGTLSAKFIKNGANDFLQKPFNHEELHCRIMHSVETLELVAKIRDSANRDYLTGAYNRRYFFSKAVPIHAQAMESGTPLAAAVLDIDHFKSVNDTHGHDAGDIVLKKLSEILDQTLGRFLVARAGGEEFFVLLPGLTNKKASELLDKVRQIVSETPFDIGDEILHINFSCGVSNGLTESIDDQINVADGYLYRAKEAGRNIVIDDDF